MLMRVSRVISSSLATSSQASRKASRKPASPEMTSELRDSRLPQRLYPGYWDNLARCCGTAGVGKLLLDRFQAAADPALLTWANMLAADVLARTAPTPSGVTWSNTQHTRTPPDLQPAPGFMQGTRRDRRLPRPARRTRHSARPALAVTRPRRPPCPADGGAPARP
ncbi:hypothetical protein ACFOX0_32640 [Micromonospora zhanjiangensis]|uniref:Uncharacterized protein n=1 Tax=Micromonospora zhanjiangensis TaxID=1522057 RepID=A0ABV8KX07_9ACTN